MGKSPIRHAVEKLGRFFRNPAAAPIGDARALAEFLNGQAAFVAQTALYGYLRTRMGRRYREMFGDENLAPALTAARDGMYYCCLRDLTVWTIAVVMAGRLPADRLAVIAGLCHRRATGLAPAGMAAPDRALEGFASRLSGLDWVAARDSDRAFSESPEGLVRLAPVSAALRDQDREIIANSVRFRWIEVRRQFRARLNGDTLAADLDALAGTEVPPDGVRR